jgi:protocatechuate 3,4-dioxygenase beta subunit
MSTTEAVSAELAAMLSACTVCRSWAEQIEGPYYGDTQPLRRDIVEDREGVPLLLGLRLAADHGTSMPDATVEIWHCDALGRYSGFPPPNDLVVETLESAPRGQYLPDQTFLRGRQHTDAAGMVEFRTIYPSWYAGRTVHIHVMVHEGQTTFTSQLYFPDDVNDLVLSQAPYAERLGRDTTNDNDEIFPTGGDPLLLDVSPGNGGYLAAICLVIPARSNEPYP